MRTEAIAAAHNDTSSCRGTLVGSTATVVSLPARQGLADGGHEDFRTLAAASNGL